MAEGDERQFEPAWDEVKRTEVDYVLHLCTKMTSQQRAVLMVDCGMLPSLQNWSFGLIGKAGVSEQQLKELGAQILELCDGQLAHFDYQPEGLPYYDKDNFGLAIIEHDDDELPPPEGRPQIEID